MRAILEICVETSAGWVAAKTGGADRVELCSALGVGGLTPSYGLMRTAGLATGLDVMAMIRPRAGDFIWSSAEAEAMMAEIGMARDLGLGGVVIGAMDAAGQLDIPLLRRLITAAQGMDVTLHRVVDLLDDPVAAIEIAADLGIKRILTSGGALRAIDGMAVLAKMVSASRGRVSIMAGAGLRVEHIAPLAAVGIREFHASASQAVAEEARLAKFGFAGRRETDAGIVAALKAAVLAVT